MDVYLCWNILEINKIWTFQARFLKIWMVNQPAKHYPTEKSIKLNNKS